MPLPTIAGVHRVAVRGQCANGQPWINVLHFRQPTGVTTTDFKTALLTQLHNIYDKDGVTGVGTSGWATLGGLASAVLDFTRTPLDGLSASEQVPLPITGAATGDALPSDTALVITLRTNLRGRSYRGRTYWAGLTEVNNDAQGHLLLANQQEVTANWAAVIAHAANASARLVVASYKNSTSEDVTTVSINNQFDRQRRRK